MRLFESACVCISTTQYMIHEIGYAYSLFFVAVTHIKVHMHIGEMRIRRYACNTLNTRIYTTRHTLVGWGRVDGSHAFTVSSFA